MIMAVALVNFVPAPATVTSAGTKIAHAVPGLPGGAMASTLVDAMDATDSVTTLCWGQSEGGEFCAGIFHVVVAAAAAGVFGGRLTRRQSGSGFPSSGRRSLLLTRRLWHCDFAPSRWHWLLLLGAVGGRKACRWVFWGIGGGCAATCDVA